jgi:hypothetical protein
MDIIILSYYHRPWMARRNWHDIGCGWSSVCLDWGAAEPSRGPTPMRGHGIAEGRYRRGRDEWRSEVTRVSLLTSGLVDHRPLGRQRRGPRRDGRHARRPGRGRRRPLARHGHAGDRQLRAAHRPELHDPRRGAVRARPGRFRQGPSPSPHRTSSLCGAFLVWARRALHIQPWWWPGPGA